LGADDIRNHKDPSIRDEQRRRFFVSFLSEAKNPGSSTLVFERRFLPHPFKKKLLLFSVSSRAESAKRRDPNGRVLIASPWQGEARRIVFDAAGEGPFLNFLAHRMCGAPDNCATQMSLVSANRGIKIAAGAADRMSLGRKRPWVSKDRRVG